MADRALRRTLSALDWEVIVAALARHARTTRGMTAAGTITLATTAPEIRARYVEVEEVFRAEDAGDRVPVGGVPDIVDELERAGRGVILEVGELRGVYGALRALHSLRGWADDNAELFPRIAGLAAPISIDPALLSELGDAFDTAGELSEDRWPELGQLRRKVEQLRDRIRHTLDDILRGDDWGDALQDRFFTERDGRFVVPIKMGARRGLGIMHGTSQSGETAWVEPAVVVELHNDLRTTEGELVRVERRILAELTRVIGIRHTGLLAAVDAATEIDLACARAGLGRELRGTIPIVGTDGVLRLIESRHPVLALRASADERDGAPPREVVSNDLALTPDRPGLILTGPNAGGKTVALKTLGLAAALVRASIPVPADEGSRVDLFDPILADIGDAQSVESGLSTFSAHVTALKAAIAGSRPGALVLLDEVAVGTDPAQGAALARAVLEAVVDAGARVAVTTHYPELKAVTDDRFVVAAAQYADGKPTYRLELGVPGPSYALQMARRLGLPEAILERAHALLDEGTRELAERLERLTEERAAVRRHAESLDGRDRNMREREKKLAEAEGKLQREGEKRVAAMTEKASEKLRKREEEVKAMVAALQAGADLKTANATLAGIRAALAEVRAPRLPADLPAAAPIEVEVGDKVRVRTIGQVGRVTGLGDQVEVEVGRLRMRVGRDNLELLGAKAEKPVGPAGVVGKILPAARVEEPELGNVGARVRTGANTCDLRGMRAEEALTESERFLDAMVRLRFSPAFLLHGHGTGALKVAIRAWLPQCRYAKSWRPADADEGGDAYTVVDVG